MADNPLPPFALEPRHVRRAFEAKAAGLARQDFLAREAASRMAERLDYIRHTPSRILDLGCGHGADLPLLAQHYPQAERLGLDVSLPLLHLAPRAGGLLGRLFRREITPRLICADASQLPLATGSVDMVWSNLLLHWLPDPKPAFREMHRVLRTDGLLMFATLGPDTLAELRTVLPEHSLHRFIDMHDLGDDLVHAGFAAPVMDMQRITLTYPDFDSLLRELRTASAGNARADRPHGLGRRARWQAARETAETLRQDGKLSLTVELVFGHAWRAAPRQIEDGRAIIQLHRPVSSS
ncbi:MAG: malonyl-[acyl-carrier protein] O-methyltransferase BioC [Candidatus Dactylopiibacterium carminicum]|uniref:Malonyl-[acyl-carrier protein] O-methyltransferase n=1 Tax=Candidatus Dactylopiibacterium carminicum TaxID=857335 RepID=A0A272EUD3_9RHOO|nr:methyltransferase domain-containing protein [Candidatus Dactylopiibacterium carminicum]KAF7599350.1 malonyl-[acyl-carrier protein] O-methyltransferase BioC [Candidatus Dactylopiibacterium carminicum]PAS93360.1 MAG: malonyl-[acyl-carrier protein] O-methyltransferase BioC [Candidatus Dactylopiibacterium carminicum]PAS98314.1 MAG: malonyl-[acyl-carrier protein] O-methyltransferase BioC [Candidatus Dactylopiibacterium carminicum]PAS99356.1 MAG: malonyl-[acyl-carrier protein] O-methyltransferase 